MAKRSLQASAEGIRKAKQAFKRKGWTQEYLAAEVGLETRQAIWKFFTGQRIDRHVFNDICFALELDIAEIAQSFTTDESGLLDSPANLSLDIETVVHKLRSVYHKNIQMQCGTVQILDVAQTIQFHDIYVDVEILEEINSRRWLEIKKFPQVWIKENNCLGVVDWPQTRTSGIAAVKKYDKLMVLGKPGIGKTTFLQAIANSCNLGLLYPDYLPIFLRLKDFAEDIRGSSQISLFNYLCESFLNLGISEQELNTVFTHGRALILLDGLDEVLEKDVNKIINKIRQITEKFCKNKIIITCRLGIQNYKFYGFTEVEIGNFSQPQIANFAEKWFLAIAKQTPALAKELASRFMQKLELKENLPILDLASTPLLLNFICLVFQFNEDFPNNRAEIYKQILDLLLTRWDEAKGVKRDEIYPNFSLLHKIKLLSHLAAITFPQSSYFQPQSHLCQLITDYLLQNFNPTHDAAALEIESASVLQAIEAQHGLLMQKALGIYAFSHFSLQQYFTAKEIVTNLNSQTLAALMKHLNKKYWREVFLLSAGMLNPADELLKSMKEKIDNLSRKNSKIHHFLIWLMQKSAAVKTSYHVASVRAFYFTLALPPESALACNQELAILLDNQLAGNLATDLALDLALTHGLTVSLGINPDIFLPRFSALSLSLDLKHLLANQPELLTALQNLKNQLPSPSQGGEVLKIWWQDNGKNWTESLRNWMITNRKVGHNWQFNSQDLEEIQQYWDANQLLLDCLKTATDVSPQLRNYLETSLFLPGKSDD
ncbi:NACHT domain-containing NTPase [Nostoc sp. FACHB-87]|uniref:NACHT domain-containing protein n=1 Tax=Nostocaceae TaxID=1162 RepID=UPI00168A383A|nr:MULTISPECIES: NACHT domain-containing NTPase [Nostocaceae]MBD2452485.1 NACHT domain-containing NTPase [Nostoc sp. FACHB-87]MBD2473415.1 NACHT domain-containing NTPase [Anabaena sp. FACHB-83]